MLHVWLIPALFIAFLVIAAFYLLIRSRGGTGERTHGRVIVDKPDDDAPPPPG